MSLDSVRVLIVDDDGKAAENVRTQLSQGGSPTFLIDCTQTYKEALTLLTSRPYEVCLLTRKLNGRDGLELIQTASRLGCTASMIILTDNGGEEAEKTALEQGAADYLIKGHYDSTTLQRVIRHALYRAHAEAELRHARHNLEEEVQTRTAELSNAIATLTQEIEQREIAERQFREAEARYRIIFEEATDAIVLVSVPDGHFADFNTKAFSQLGYTREEFKTLSLNDIEAVETPGEIQDHIRRIIAGGDHTFETQHKTKNGDRRDVLISTRPIALGGTQYILCTFHDFTERKQIEEKLRGAIIRLEQHNVEKSEFVANVSHELKTPLTSMIYGIHNLLRGIAGPLPPHAVQYLKLFNNECHRLVNTINDILDLSKLDNKVLTLSAATIPLGHLISRRLDALKAEAEAAGITVTPSLSPHTPFVRCDPNMIQRVLQNILGNALKFTPHGGAVDVTTVVDPGNQGFARITITDNGPGIPANALTHIAERYFRANNRASGSGLGLAISKEIITLHGGTLTVASPPPGRPEGTEVTFTLPLAEAPTVLVGDDDQVIQDLLRIHLESHGYHVITVDSGQEVILTAEASRPDIILLDLIMEDVHGTTVILALRGSPSIRYIPIIAITGATLDEGTTAILARFSIPTLPKPWNVTELLDTIETALMGMTAFQLTTAIQEVRA